jgi:acyl-CoA oxidase
MISNLTRHLSISKNLFKRTLATTSTSDFNVEQFTEDFLAQISDVPVASDPAMSAAILRRLVKSKVLKFNDMEDAPEKFFLAHRLLSTVGLGGFGIRFTVQFNLFAGSIVGLAGPEQREMLKDIQEKGQLGCFLLTEMQAGVLSGLIVETTADWDPKTQEFVLHTPNDKAAKNWISQGYTAELGVVIADLRVDGKSHGPHPFFINLRDGKGKNGGSLLPGIRIDDMGIKTIANDLDNARVWFDQVRLPKDSLLNKYCTIENDQYKQVGDQPMNIEVLGARLLTGRQVIAESALVSARVLHQKTEEYAKSKICNGLAGEVMLSEMPQLKSVFDESYRQIDELIGFSSAVGKQLADCLRNGEIPSSDLQDAISVCKIRCIDVAIQRVHALRMEVGSYALMHDTGFELVDMYLCCKFAEGDSRILQQKLTRDRLKKLQKGGVVAGVLQAINPMDSESSEAMTALMLGQKLAPAGRDRKKMAALMEEHWEEIYTLADQVAARHVRTQVPSTFPEEIVDRLECATTDFDVAWKEKLDAWNEELQ